MCFNILPPMLAVWDLWKQENYDELKDESKCLGVTSNCIPGFIRRTLSKRRLMPKLQLVSSGLVLFVAN